VTLVTSLLAFVLVPMFVFNVQPVSYLRLQHPKNRTARVGRWRAPSHEGRRSARKTRILEEEDPEEVIAVGCSFNNGRQCLPTS